MACVTGRSMQAYIMNRTVFDAWYCEYTSQLGEWGVFAVFAILGVMLVGYSPERPFMPLVLAILLGGVIVPLLPGTIAGALTAAAIIGIAVVGMGLYIKLKGGLR